MVYNYIQANSNSPEYKTESEFWHLSFDDLTPKKTTFKDYIEQRKKQNLPDDVWKVYFDTTFKLERNGG